jgi:hypothetical protein
MFELELSRKKQRKASQDRVEPFGEAVELWRLNARDQIEVNNILRAELGFKTTESEKLSPPEAKSVVMLAAMKELSNLIETSNIDVV